MPLKQTTIEGQIFLPTNQPASITSVVFTLMASDEEGDLFVAKHSVNATIGEEGRFSITVWPNEAGDRGNTRYQVAVTLGNGASLDPIPNLYVWESDDPIRFDDLILEGSTIIPGYTNRVMSVAQYEALTVYAPRTLYLVRL